MKVRERRWQYLFTILCAIVIVGIIPKPLKAEAATYQGGYNETTINMTKYVGDTHTFKTNIDGVAYWNSSDPSIARIDSYNSSYATVTFLKVGKVTVTFQHSYNYIQPVFEQTDLTTGKWYAENSNGVTVIRINIDVKEGLGTSLFAGGLGTAASPYLISTKKQLANINNTGALKKCFKLTNDIVFSPEDFEAGGEFYNDTHGWFPIGFCIPGVYGQVFSGTFDGDGHVISGLKCYYNGSGSVGVGYFGLFGVNNGTIKNLGIENSSFLCFSISDISNELEYVGGIAGANTGTIKNCYVKKCNIGGNCAGGIAGYQLRFMYDCFSSYNTFGVTQLYLDHPKSLVFGGLAGAVDVLNEASPTICDCYTANLNFMGWNTKSAALAGYLLYSTVITHCYYNNSEVNAIGNTSGTVLYTKLTEDLMKNQSSFLDLDFANTWIMDSTGDYLYPKLKSFVKLEQALYISSLPKKNIYLVGEKLDLSGGEISFTNAEGNTYNYLMTDEIFNPLTGTTVTDVQKGTISAVDMSTPGTKTITVEYMGQKVEFQIFVIDSKMESKLEISCESIEYGKKLEPEVNNNDSQATVVFKYYSDSQCKIEITEPSKPGTYYVRAYTEETDCYKEAVSNVVKFDILEFDDAYYAAVYDYMYYINANPDLKAAFGADTAAALQHFVNYGMAEGRQASADFNVIAYRKYNPDLVFIYGDDLKSYYLHYITSGKKEGRKAVESIQYIGKYNAADYAAVFDLAYYKTNNPDIVTACKNNDAAIVDHFVDYGMSEGRQGSAEFNVTAYRKYNPDLVAAFEDNLKNYYLHYIECGKREGRKAVESNNAYIGKYNAADYAAVFDLAYYKTNNPDVESALGNNDAAMVDHFVDYGMAEGRQASTDFNVTAYRKYNPDLVVVYGNDLKSYYLHYIACGKKEGRKAIESSTAYIGKYIATDYAAVFDLAYYKAYNPDVVTACGNNDAAIVDHFVDYGMAEGRQGCVAFNVTAYRKYNPDLVNVYGNDLKSYYLHYMACGKTEGRKAIDDTTYLGKYNAADYAAVFDLAFFKEHNPDVAAGSDDAVILEYFVENGMAEGRWASAEFNVFIYMSCNPDLYSVYGDDFKSYYLHYINCGKREGRIAK